MIRPRIKMGNARRGFQPSATPPAPPSPPDLASRVAALETQVVAQQALVTTQGTQIAALQTTLNAKPSMNDVNAAINTNSAANADSVYYMQLAPSDPPTQSDVQAVIDRLNELITALNRQL